VVTASCAQAEVAAKVAFVLGPTESATFLEQVGVAGLLVEENGQRTIAGPWPDDLRALLLAAPALADTTGGMNTLTPEERPA
jgi:thiamine biosynthesis lipoprotein ApbE